MRAPLRRHRPGGRDGCHPLRKRVGGFEGLHRDIAVPDGLGIMGERDAGVRMASKLGHQPDFDALRRRLPHRHGWGPAHTHALDVFTDTRPSWTISLGLGLAGGLLPDPGALALLLAACQSNSQPYRGLSAGTTTPPTSLLRLPAAGGAPKLYHLPTLEDCGWKPATPNRFCPPIQA